MTLDAWARLHLDRGGRFSSYRALGTLGWLTAQVLVLGLHRAAGAPMEDVLIVSLATVASFLVAMRVSYILLGHERIVFYEHALLALGASALALRAAHRPLAPGLDLAVLGVGTFLAFGRVGCLMASCCHGRPARRGIRYTDAHADAGLPRRLVGVPLFPIQVVDGALALALVAAAAVLTAGAHTPGAPAALWLAGYGAGRFVIELFRGDDVRPRLGLTEAQWTAVAIGWGLAALQGFTPVALAYAFALTAGGGALLAIGARGPLRGVASPWHAAELANILDSLRRLPEGSAATTSLGVRAQRLRRADGGGYALSRDRGAPMSRRALEMLVAQLGGGVRVSAAEDATRPE